MLAKMLSLQLGLEGLVGGLGVDGLLLEDGQDAHRLLEELEAGGQVHPEVASHPDDAFAHVLLLLQDEHGAEIEIIFCSFTFLSLQYSLVEELLQLFVDKVDADLFEGVELEDLESSDVEDADERHLLHGWILIGGIKG